MNIPCSQYPIHKPGTIVTSGVQNNYKKAWHCIFYTSFSKQQSYFLKIRYTLLLLAFSFLPRNTYCQNLIPLLENGNKWSVKHTEDPYGPLHPTQTIRTTWYKMGSDTLINTKSYKIILESNDSLAIHWKLSHIMREEGGQVYTYISNAPDELLYNFNLEVNDSMIINNWSQPKVSKLVLKHDTLIDNILRVKYHYINYWLGYEEFTFPETCIEGIGSLFGLTRSTCAGCTPCYSVEELSCFYENDTMKYQSCPTCKCYVLVTSVDKMPGIKDLKVVPNPASDVLEITSPSILSGYEIFNQYGVLIKKDNINANRKTIDISGLLTGIYIIKVYDTNKHFTSTKIIIQ